MRNLFTCSSTPFVFFTSDCVLYLRLFNLYFDCILQPFILVVLFPFDCAFLPSDCTLFPPIDDAGFFGSWVAFVRR